MPPREVSSRRWLRSDLDHAGANRGRRPRRHRRRGPRRRGPVSRRGPPRKGQGGQAVTARYLRGRAGLGAGALLRLGAARRVLRWRRIGRRPRCRGHHGVAGRVAHGGGRRAQGHGAGPRKGAPRARGPGRGLQRRLVGEEHRVGPLQDRVPQAVRVDVEPHRWVQAALGGEDAGEAGHDRGGRHRRGRPQHRRLGPLRGRRHGAHPGGQRLGARAPLAGLDRRRRLLRRIAPW
mmetsp:Transcript_121072/g.337186  ORF Transcript_121072/g.337186 Transcript_121072/m.337186 type:complete len:234 (+) Transcript_121072:372-1073(+)